MKVVSLQECPQIFESCMELVEESFGYQSPYSFAIDCHGLVKRKNFPNLFALLNEGKVLAHAGFLSKRIRVAGKNFPVVLLGAVATREDSRGRGYFSVLWNHMLERMPPCLGYFLWSGLNSFYEKFGFHQVGMVESVGNKKFSVPVEYEKVSYEDLSESERADIHRLHKSGTQNLIALERDEGSWEDIARTMSADLFVRPTHDGRIESYFFVNKGWDLQGIVHEIFGRDRNSLLKDLRGSLAWLPGTIDGRDILYSGLFKIGNPGIFQDFVQTLSDGAILTKKISNEKVAFTFKGERLELSCGDFLQGILGPNVFEEFQGFYRPLWFGGLDSI